MKQANFKFIGYDNKFYCFIDHNGTKHFFVKCRKDLIEEFQLNESLNQNQWFQVNFFQANPNNKMDEFGEKINIISDMKIINA